MVPHPQSGVRECVCVCMLDLPLNPWGPLQGGLGRSSTQTYDYIVAMMEKQIKTPVEACDINVCETGRLSNFMHRLTDNYIEFMWGRCSHMILRRVVDAFTLLSWCGTRDGIHCWVCG